MVKDVQSRSQFALLCGVTPAAVTKACAKCLAPAIVGRKIDAGHSSAINYRKEQDARHAKTGDNGLDVLLDDAIDFCRAHSDYTKTGLRRHLKIGHRRAERLLAVVEASGPLKPPPKASARGREAQKAAKKGVAPTDEFFEVPENITEFADLTIRQVVARFGTDARFVDYLKSLQTLEAIRERQLKNAKTAGELVNRDLIETGILEPVDGMIKKLLTDGAKTIARRLPAMSKSGGTEAELEEFITGVISSFVRPMKARTERVLNDIVSDSNGG